MLGIRRIGASRVDYYLSDMADEVPVPGHGAGRWVGAAMQHGMGMGLDGAGAVDPAAFRTLLSGGHPGTGRPLPMARTGAGRRVAGFDLTFSAPKSASVVFALGGEDVARTVIAAHVAAVDGAVDYLERRGLGAVRRRGDGGEEREVIATSGFAGAMFTHGINRNLDPHLHSHVVVVNAVHGADGRWSACDGRGLDAHRRAAAGVYEAHLRHELTGALGVRWEARPDRTPEIAGVPPALLGEFSSRGADIRMRVQAVGVRSSAGRRVAWAATRPPKMAGTPYDDLAREWQRRASFAGPALDLEGRLRRATPTSPPTSTLSALSCPSYDEHRFGGVISSTPHGGAHRRDVVAAFATSALDGVPSASLDRVTELWAPGQEVGVAEGLMARSCVVPANHHLRALGPRPIDPAGHETWMQAARTIDTYRERWGVERRAIEPLGVDRDRPLSSLPPSRLADHLRTARHLDAARVRLGRRAPAEMELGLGR